MPERATAVPAITSDAVRGPAARGRKLRVALQLAPAVRKPEQDVVPLKSPASAPVIETAPMVSAPVPVFVSVTDWAAPAVPTVSVPNARDVALSEATGVPVFTPVPVRATDWGEPVALSVNVSLAVRAAAAAGLKVTETLQLAAAARDRGQVDVPAKSAALAPVNEIELRVTAAVPLFATVTV